MIKISHIIPAVTLIMALTLHCGETVDEVQSFRPNQGPVILEFTHDLPDGTPITASTAITLYARASDPEGRPMRFEFLSEDGSFSNQVNGRNESTVIFHSAGYLVSAQEVKAAVRVYDSKRFTDSMEILLGVTMAGPSVKIEGEFCPYVRPDGMTEFSFTANASGLCQYYARQDEDPTAQFDPSEPCFYYSKGEVKTITVGGPDCVFSNVNLFDEAQTPDRLYIILTDSLGQEGVNSVMFYVDGVSPESAASPDGGRFPSSLPVTITGTDNSSGCAAISYTLNGTDPNFSGNGTVVTGSKAQFAVGSTKGIYELRYRAKDRAGNIENIKSALFEIGVADVGVYQGATGIPSGGMYDIPVYTKAGETSDPVTFTIRNEGNLDLILFGVNHSNTADYALDDSGMDYTLGPGEATTFKITYSPIERVTYSTTITVSSDDPDEGTYAFSVNGDGGDCDIALSQGSTDIPSGGDFTIPGYTEVYTTGEPVIFTIKNEGEIDLNINNVTSSDAQFALNTAGMSNMLAPGASTQFRIEFMPVSPVLCETIITVTSDDPDEGSYAYTLFGQGALYILSYAGNGTETGGTPPVDNNLYGEGQNVTAPGHGTLTGALIRDGITQAFVEWNESPDGSGKSYAPGDTIQVPGHDLTLYAQWTTDNDVLRKIGPAGGWVFYDAGSAQAWGRYLEAAPGTTEWNTKQFSSNPVTLGTSFDIGTGAANTALIVSYLNSSGQTDKAALLCSDLVYGGYDDWFLPSIQEFVQLRDQLGNQGVGGYSGYYWSSSFSSQNRIFVYGIPSGMLGAGVINYYKAVAVRAFY